MLLSTRFYERDPVIVARALLGQLLVRVIDGQRLAGLIVETEAYLGAPDAAAHTFNGRRTPRNESMYLGGGHAYVYFTYGMHHCMNVVGGCPGDGVAVLIRALQPTEGLDVMRTRRPHARREAELCSGPGKLCAALGIDRKLDGSDLTVPGPLCIEEIRRRALPASRIAIGPRVGVHYAGHWAHKPLRFWIKGNPHVSRR
jgi:DNA-3-methyladenine glycosylase